jgi:hypothetical protein
MAMLEVLHVHQAFEEQSFGNFVDDDNEMAAISIPLGLPCMEEEMYPRLRSAILALDWRRFCPRNLQILDVSFLPMDARPDSETLPCVLLANESR